VKRIGEQMIAEFIGTMLFVFIVAGSVIVFGLVVSRGNLDPTLAAVGLVPIALAQGLGLAIMVSNSAHISGGHLNPAVTVSIWVAGKIDAVRALLYIVAQLAGAAAGAGILSVIVPKSIWNQTHLGATTVNLHPFGSINFSPGRAVFFEAMITFILVYTVFATAVDERGSFKALSGLPIGLAVSVGVLIGGYFTGGSMNPARSFGPALISGHWTDFWVYIIGPVTGGILAAALYWFSYLRARPLDLELEDVAAAETGGEEAVLETVIASDAETAVDAAVLDAVEAADEDGATGVDTTPATDAVQGPPPAATDPPGAPDRPAEPPLEPPATPDRPAEPPPGPASGS
jgi:MIP family channel proteins